MNNLRKSTIAFILTGAIAGSYISWNLNKNKRNVDFELGNDVSFETALNDVSELTKVDEIIKSSEIKNLTNDTSSLDEVLAAYKDARISKNMYSLNNALENLGFIVLKSSILDALNVDVKNVHELKLNSDGLIVIKYDNVVTNVVPGNIVDKSIVEVTKKYNITGEGLEIAKIIFKAQSHTYNVNEVDIAYLKLIKFLYSSPEVKNGFFGVDNIDFKYDEQKIKALQK